MYGEEKSDAAILAVKPANKMWKTTRRSWWSEGLHPRGKRKVGFIPGTVPGYMSLPDGCGRRVTVVGTMYRLRLEAG